MIVQRSRVSGKINKRITGSQASYVLDALVPIFPASWAHRDLRACVECLTKQVTSATPQKDKESKAYSCRDVVNFGLSFIDPGLGSRIFFCSLGWN